MRSRPTNAQLFELTGDFVLAMAGYLGRLNVQAEAFESFDQWSRVSRSVFRRVKRQAPIFRRRLHSHRRAMTNLPQFEALAELFRTEPELSRFSAETVALDLLARLGQDIGPGWNTFSVKWAFENLYPSFERSLLDPHVYLSICAPLAGCVVQQTVELGEAVVLAPLRDEDLAAALRLGVAGEIYRDDGFCDVQAGVFLDYAVSVDPGRPVDRVNVDAWLDEVVLALRMGAVGDMGIVGWWEKSDHLYRNVERGQRRREPPVILKQMVLDAENMSGAKEAFRLIRGGALKRYPSLRNAVRRFQWASERDRAADQIVDLVIACESLFADGNTAEARHRMALRGAYFLAENAGDRRRIFEILTSAYDLRSAVVHGRAMTEDSRLAEHISALTQLLRAGLVKTLRLAEERAGGPLVKWEELVLGIDAPGNAGNKLHSHS